jgi:2-polyprenyl-3-methyl-5-hydroxy-6-metoxy-1,4-benzoquinol methylase
VAISERDREEIESDALSPKIKCPVCNKEDTVKLFSKEGRIFVQCKEDRLVYINPQPEREELQEVYNTYGKEIFVLPESIAAIWNYPDYRKRFLDFRKTNRLLEIGAAAGGFLVWCRKDGWDTYGVELSCPSSQFARDQQGLNVTTGPLLDAKYPDNFFDVVVAWQTLEHIPNPREVVEEVWRILRPGGFWVLSVPRWKGLSTRLLGKKYRYVGRDHLFYFSRENMARMLSNVGFSNVYTRTAGFNPIVFYQDARGFRKNSSNISCQRYHSAEDLVAQWKKHCFVRFIHRIYSKTIEALDLGDTLFAEGVKAISPLR